MRFDAKTFLEGLFRADTSIEVSATQPDVDLTPDDLPPYWREHFEERAGVREFCGGQAREHAEAEALRETIEAMQRSANNGN